MNIQSLLSQIWHTAADETVDLPLPAELPVARPLTVFIDEYSPNWRAQLDCSRVYDKEFLIIDTTFDLDGLECPTQTPTLIEYSTRNERRFSDVICNDVPIQYREGIQAPLYVQIQALRSKCLGVNKFEDCSIGKVFYPVFVNSHNPKDYLSLVNIEIMFFEHVPNQGQDRIRFALVEGDKTIHDEVIVLQNGAISHTRFVQYGEGGYGFLHGEFYGVDRTGSTSYAGLICDVPGIIEGPSVLISASQNSELKEQKGNDRSKGIYPLPGDPSRSIKVLSGVTNIISDI